MTDAIDRAACEARDAADPLAPMREKFLLPPGVIYLDGNSLGPLPAQTPARLAAVVQREWGDGLVRSWTDADWMAAPSRVGAKIARLVGAGDDEVVVAESTSVCLFKLVCAALEMRPGRSVVLTEQENFHSDLYVAAAAARLCGGTLQVVPRAELGEALSDQVALLLLTHVDYRTGFMHDMSAMSRAAHDAGALAVWDLSHSTCAVPLRLNADGVDMATGCGYKYLNGGPGAPAFLHVRAGLHPQLRNPVPGWLGHAEPFAFEPSFRAATGLRSMITGSPHILQLSALEAAVDLWLDIDFSLARDKSIALTELFIALVDDRCAGVGLELASPRSAACRGSQVSLRHPAGHGLMQALIAHGVIGDFRPPDLCRFGLAPLYVRFVDVWDAVEQIRAVLDSDAHRDSRFTTLAAIT